jgi:tRNA modification GTPase
VVWNKSDIAPNQKYSNGFTISAKRGVGFRELSQEMLFRLRKGATALDDQQLVIESSRQHGELMRTRDALERVIELAQGGLPLDIIASELNEALNGLGSITGEVTSSDILESVFSNFCVGK